MTTDARLESYLTSLERVLRPFPVSDRAEIVTEIKSHVLSTLERDPQTRLDSVLAALGEPETVANRYLIERGLKPTKPPISPVVKWLVIGFLGTFAMLLIFAGIVVMKFMPILHIDDLKDKVSVLGGLIEVDGEEGQVLISGGFGDSWRGAERSFDGSAPVGQAQPVSVKFGNGKLEVSTAGDSNLAWKCRGRSPQAAPSPVTDRNGITLDLSHLSQAKCEIAVPKDARLAINGSNGKLELERPRFSVAASLTNGKVEIRPDGAQAYRYELAVTNGKTDSFASSAEANAYSIAVSVVNGKISRGE